MRPGTVESTFFFLSFLLPTSELHVFFQLLQLIAHQEQKIPSGLPHSQVKGLESLFSHVRLRWMISAGPGGCEEGVVLFGEERAAAEMASCRRRGAVCAPSQVYTALRSPACILICLAAWPLCVGIPAAGSSWKNSRALMC